MTSFRVELNGVNFWIDFEGTPCRMGFYTERYVVAGDLREAELAAVQLLRGDPKLQQALNEKDDPPMIYAEGIIEVEPGDIPDVAPGLAFYAEDEDA